jgi:hypothetical protein
MTPRRQGRSPSPRIPTSPTSHPPASPSPRIPASPSHPPHPPRERSEQRGGRRNAQRNALSAHTIRNLHPPSYETSLIPKRSVALNVQENHVMLVDSYSGRSDLSQLSRETLGANFLLHRVWLTRLHYTPVAGSPSLYKKELFA